MATLSARARSLVSGTAVGVAVGILAAVCAVVRPDFLDGLEHRNYDVRVRAAADRAAASKDIVLVDIAEGDIEDAENNFDVIWPWPRSLYGDITTFCKRAGAKAVIFDWLFQDRGIGMADDEQFADAMRAAGNAVIGLAMTKRPLVARPLEGAWAVKLGKFPSGVEAKQAALELAGWNVRSFVVKAGGWNELWYGAKKTRDDAEKTWKRLAGVDQLAPLFAPPEGGEGGAPPAPTGNGAGMPAGLRPDVEAPAVPAEPPSPAIRELTRAELAGELTVASLIRERDGIEVAGEFPRRDGLDPPLAVIAAAPTAMGFVDQDQEPDGVMRRYAPLVVYGDRAYPSLALAGYLVAHSGVKPHLDGRTLVLGERRVALDDEGRFTIHYYGTDLYTHVHAYEVLRSLAMLDENQAPAVPLEVFKDKFVIVSAAGQALRDIRSTPVAHLQLGAEVQANALDNLLTGSFVTRASRGLDAAAAFAVCLVTSLLMIVLWRAVKLPGVALVVMATVTGTVIIGYYFIARAALGSGRLWLAFSTPAIGAALSAFATLLALTAVERRGKRFVQEALGRYTSTALVRQLIEHPEYLSLEWGEEREMSVYFSDIAGFTTISEGLGAQQLVALLNDYLTTMTDLVLEHGGVVDKYIGDAIMAFWGAPLPNPDHARQAVRCALAMRRKCDELRAGWHERFGHEVFARAGVNSGDAVVGNMGSKHKYNYTVMGDMVNLASRLEGANKPYGTFLMVSAMTVAKLGDEFDVRELDFLAVKGKEQPVTVYEVLDERGKTDPELLAAARKFEQGLALYRKRDFAGAIAVFETIVASRDDGPSKTYIERSKTFLAEPPPADWDGVWHMKEK